MIQAADRPLLERLAGETGVERRLPDPSWSDYALDLSGAFARWLGDQISPIGRLLGAHPAALEIAARLLLVALVLAVGWVLLRAVRRRPPQALPAVAVMTRARTAPAPGRDAWRREVEARLARNDVEGALEATWWFVARALLGPRAEGFQTTRELIAAARRPDLRPLGEALDRMTYAAGKPGTAEVRAFLGRAEAALG